MSSLVSALLLLVAGAPSAGAEAPATGAKAAAASEQPDVVFEETEHDFGSVFSEEGYTHRFRFRSPAGLAVTVTKVSAPCKCTAGVVRPPGAGHEWGEIEVKVNFGDADGEVGKQVQVHLATGRLAPAQIAASAPGAASAPPDKKAVGADAVPAAKEDAAAQKAPEKKGVAEAREAAQTEKREPHVVTLTLKAFVIKRGVRLTPARLVVGSLKPGVRIVRKVRAEIVTRFVPAQVTKVCCSAPWIQASVNEVPAEKDKRRAIAQVRAYELEVTLDTAKARRGRSFLEFVTLYTSAVRWPFVDLPIKGRVEK